MKIRLMLALSLSLGSVAFADQQFEVSAAASLGSLNSYLAFGPSVRVETPLNIQGERYLFGGETGFYYATKANSTGFSVPMMATGKYLFKPVETYHFYAGLGIGVSVDHSNDTLFSANGTSTNAVSFAILLHPGVSLGENGKYFIELPFGSFFNGFAFLPTFGAHF